MMDWIFRALKHIIDLQGQQMATSAELTTAVTNLTTAVQALEAKISGAAPSVPESELDPILTSLQTLTTQIEAIVNPPTP